MILENGVVRTMDPSLPTSRALAIAGAYVAGGVGVHETALASPEVVDLGGRCVLPAFTDSHVHFPTWSLAQRQVKLDGCASLDEALARIREARAAPGRWLRGYGWRDGDWSPRTEPTKEALDAVTGETPAVMISKDYHSAWLNSAALAAAGGELEVEGGVVERDAAGEPTGVLREEAAWRFRDRHVLTTEDEWVEATRAGVKLAHSRGVGAIHDKDGWLGSPGIFQRLRDEGNLSLRVWGSIPHERLDDAAALSLRSGFGDEYLRIGYLKCFMDGTLGSQHRAAHGRLRRRDHRPRGARGDRPPRRRARLARRRARDRRPGEPRRARRVRGDAGRVAAARACASGSSMRSASLPEDLLASPRSGRRAPSSSRTRPPTATSPSGSGPTGSTARTRSARCSSRAPSSRTDPMRRSRSSIRSRASRRACSGRSTTARPGGRRRR